MEIHDYNGAGKWSLVEIKRRYAALCSEKRIDPKAFDPRTHTEGDKTWIYPLLDRVIELGKQGDLACLEILIELIEDDAKMPFGKILKSYAARTLKQNVGFLNAAQIQRIRARVSEMNERGYRPREFSDFAKLASRIEAS